MHYQDAAGNWQDTVPAFESSAGGFTAARGLHQVALGNDVSLPGAVTLVTPDGKILRSAPSALAYIDRVSGKIVQLASVQSSQAVLADTNVVVWENAFDLLQADVRAKNTAAGFECDVVLRRKLPAPATLGLNPDSVELAVFTEWIGGQPDDTYDTSTTTPQGVTVHDAMFRFGAMLMDAGKAFGIEPTAVQVPVRKSWQTIRGRSFLVERTAYHDLAPLLDGLPDASAPSPQQLKQWKKAKATAELDIPAPSRKSPAWKFTANGRLIAETANGARDTLVGVNKPTGRGVVLDYMIVNSSGAYSFDGLTTYYVSGSVNIGGPGDTATFNAGTVIKYAGGVGLYLLNGTTLNWLGAPYKPVTLTAYDDISSGEPLPNATGNPTGFYASPALVLSGATNASLAITNICIRNAWTGIFDANATRSSFLIRHGQFANCDTALNASSALTLENLLFYNIQTTAIVVQGPPPPTAPLSCIADFLTLDAAAKVFLPYGGAQLTINDSLIFNATDTSGFTAQSSAIFNSKDNQGVDCQSGVRLRAGSPFKLASGGGPIAAGGHYYDKTSPAFCGIINSIRPAPSDMNLVNEMAQMTVTPPIDLAGLMLPATLNYITPNDQSIIGYHYWHCDYISFGFNVSNNSLTLTNGVVIAMYGGSGIRLQSGGKLFSGGSPFSLNRLCWASAIQELPVAGTSSGSRNLVDFDSGAAILPEAHFHFTQSDLNADTLNRRSLYYIFGQNVSSIDVQDCQFAGTQLVFEPGTSTTGAAQTCGFTNNVFVNCSVGCIRYYDDNQVANLFCNLFKAGSLNLSYTWHTANNPWTIEGNFFDVVAASIANGALMTTDYNGFSASSAFLGGSHNVVGVADNNWQTGPLGNWYYPQMSGSGLGVLVDAGSQSLVGQAGLFHYTTQLTETPEGSGLLDIGFHYRVLPRYQASAGYGTSQGANNWFYMRTIVPGILPYFAKDPSGKLYLVPSLQYVNQEWEDSGCTIGANSQQWNSSADTVRMFYCPQPGTIYITGTAYYGQSGSVDAAKIQISDLASGVQILLNWTVIPHTAVQASPSQVAIGPISVQRGEFLLFQTSQNQSGGTSTLYWDPVVSYQNLLDTDGDGLSDYVEDLNGDGIVQPGEFNWQLIDSDLDLISDFAKASSISSGQIVSGQVVSWGSLPAPDSVANRPGMMSYVGIAAGANHSIAFRQNGSVIAWGDNTYGQSTVPANVVNTIAVAAGQKHSLALSELGVISAWGDNSAGQSSPTSPNCGHWVAIAAGGLNSMALTSCGTVQVWGDNTYSQTVVPGDVASATIQGIAIGQGYCLALDTSGNVHAWGNNSSGQTTIPSGLNNNPSNPVIEVAAGSTHSVALRLDGTIVAWGDATDNALTVPPGATPALHISAGNHFTVSLNNNFILHAWGDNSLQQSTVPTGLSGIPVQAVSASQNHAVCLPYSDAFDYPVDPRRDILVIYNSSNTDSANLAGYYVANRPGFADVNLLPVALPPANYTAYIESFLNSDATDQFYAKNNPSINGVYKWFSSHPAFRPRYIVLMYGIPNRTGDGATSTQYFLRQTLAGDFYPPPMKPCITALNMSQNAIDVYGYIDAITVPNPANRVILSGLKAGYNNSSFVIDDVSGVYPDPAAPTLDPLGPATLDLPFMGLSASSIVAKVGAGPDGPHLTTAANVAAYATYGGDGGLSGPPPNSGNPNWALGATANGIQYPPTITFTGSSWYIVQDIDSYSGQWVPQQSIQQSFTAMFQPTSFGGANYSQIPVGTATWVNEPGATISTEIYFSMWGVGRSFSKAGWLTVQGARIQFQLTGDPLVTR
jgi:hypothetical protein